MANRTATYFAFDGLGEDNPTKSDFRYYSTIKAWTASKHIEFRCANSHDKASAVRATSLMTTLRANISKRLSVSKNMVVIISSDTRKTGSLLSWEIEKAVDTYDLPLLVCDVGYEKIVRPAVFRPRWPRSLEARIDNRSAKAIHMPFKKNAILGAINRFTLKGEAIGGSLVHYNGELQEQWNRVWASSGWSAALVVSTMHKF